MLQTGIVAQRATDSTHRQWDACEIAAYSQGKTVKISMPQRQLLTP